MRPVENECYMNNCCIDEKCALSAVIQSIAMMEASLASIVCGEGEKLKKAVCVAKNLDDLICINKSVRETVEVITQLEDELKQKTVYAIEELKELRKTV